MCSLQQLPVRVAAVQRLPVLWEGGAAAEVEEAGEAGDEGDAARVLDRAAAVQASALGAGEKEKVTSQKEAATKTDTPNAG